MFLQVTAAKYVNGYKIELSFNDGRHGIADLTDALSGPVFEPLNNESQFSDFRVDEELETIVWATGADMAPEYLYFQAFKDNKELQEQFRQWGYIHQ
ncbi:DUF2442 domain-containing protein [Thioflexithrix psekupsensis]|uniref:DUF2442 domain-containing protein n=1 Tax=Thioflexithrix psekupsensis TaxID=1570016 RepID=A0A251X8H1_9GAMM|nr:DUF2442 domain-containing protein [Thioflexithrix psekupsensis]OUD14368.1 hypothetical protein TPSD3_08615 [Thioflexithrix psekupsensis]